MKIDYVMPYVDNSDPAWQKLYCQYSNENKHSKSENLKRFSTNVLFKYVFRGLEKYMPQINNVFLIVQSESQIPKWVNLNTVKIVFHHEFIPEEFLPTFNSCTIECFIHKIPGLSPFYIYGNDDTYFTKKISDTLFFKDFMPLNRLEHHWYIPADQYAQMCMNMNKIALSGYNMHVDSEHYFTPIHFQQAFSKSIVSNIFEEFKSQIFNSITKFRNPKNLSQYFFILRYMFSTQNKFKFKNCSYKRYDIISEFPQILNMIETKQYPQLLCLNNNDNKNDISLICQLEKIFSEKSKYEV